MRDDTPRWAIVCAILGAICVLVALCTEVNADSTVLRVKSPSTLTTDRGSVVKLPPVRIVDEETWGRLDEEFKRLQAIETRLGAENKSLRASASSSRVWKWAVAAVVVGFASGVAVQAARQ